MSQTLGTTPGSRYRLSFSLGVDQAVPAYRGPVSVAVAVGAETNMFAGTVRSESQVELTVGTRAAFALARRVDNAMLGRAGLAVGADFSLATPAGRRCVG